MIRKTILLLLIPVLFTSGCEEVFIGKEQENSFLNNFEILWKTIDENYTYFEAKNIDWNAVYNTYRPQVERLQEDDVRGLFDIFNEMLFNLEDGHVNLQAGFDFTRYEDWRLNFPQNFNFDNVERNYLLNPERSSLYEITGPFYNAYIDTIGYVYYNSFTEDFSGGLIDYLVNKYSAGFDSDGNLVSKGLIIDVRDNGGGSVTNARTLAKRFAEERTRVYNVFYKKGPGRDDFTEPVPEFIEPAEATYNGPVVILTNRSCYSATTFFVQMMREVLPNTRLRIIGDNTGGGGGLPISKELPIGWRYRFSSTVTLAPGSRNINSDNPNINIEFGIPVDEQVSITEQDIAAGRDPIIERAIELISNAFNEQVHRSGG
jgi:hypothetical protein